MKNTQNLHICLWLVVLTLLVDTRVPTLGWGSVRVVDSAPSSSVAPYVVTATPPGGVKPFWSNVDIGELLRNTVNAFVASIPMEIQTQLTQWFNSLSLKIRVAVAVVVFTLLLALLSVVCSWLLRIYKVCRLGAKLILWCCAKLGCCGSPVVSVVKRQMQKARNSYRMRSLKPMKERRRLEDEELLTGKIYDPLSGMMKEAAMPCSRIYEADDYPAFQGEIVASGEVMGYFSRVIYNSCDCLLTAAHVLESNKLGNLCLARGKLQYSFNEIKPVRILAYSPSDELDYILMEIPTSIFSKLGLKAGKMANKVRNSMPVSVYRKVKDLYGVASGVLMKDSRTPWAFKHGCSTNPGVSGAPVVTMDRKIVGIHLQYDRDMRVNTGIIPPLLYRKVIKESPTNEDAFAGESVGMSNTEYLNMLAEEAAQDVERLEAVYREFRLHDHEDLMATKEPRNWAEEMDFMDELMSKARDSETNSSYDQFYYVGTKTHRGRVKESKYFCPECLNLVVELHNVPDEHVQRFAGCVRWRCDHCNKYMEVREHLVDLKIVPEQDDIRPRIVKETKSDIVEEEPPLEKREVSTPKPKKTRSRRRNNKKQVFEKTPIQRGESTGVATTIGKTPEISGVTSGNVAPPNSPSIQPKAEKKVSFGESTPTGMVQTMPGQSGIPKQRKPLSRSKPQPGKKASDPAISLESQL